MMKTERLRSYFRAKGTLGYCLAAGLLISLSAWGEQVELENGVTLNYVVVNGGVHVGNTNAPYAAVSTDICGRIALPKSIEDMPVTEIGPYAFSGCSLLAEVVVPASVTNIGEAAFQGCGRLPNICLPQGLLALGANAFRECSSLQSVDFPSTLRVLGAGSFKACHSLTSVSIPGGTVLGVTNAVSVSEKAATTAVSSGGVTTFVSTMQSVRVLGVFEECDSLKTVTIAEGVDAIGAFAFRKCRNLETVSLPESLEAICPGAFSECPSLREIRLPERLKAIGVLTLRNENTTTQSAAGGATITTKRYSEGIKGSFGSEAGAFFRCTSLSRIEIPATVEHIGDYTFGGCTGLEEVQFMGDEPTSYGWCVLSGTPPNLIISVQGKAFGWRDPLSFGRLLTWKGRTMSYDGAIVVKKIGDSPFFVRPKTSNPCKQRTKPRFRRRGK